MGSGLFVLWVALGMLSIIHIPLLWFIVVAILLIFADA